MVDRLSIGGQMNSSLTKLVSLCTQIQLSESVEVVCDCDKELGICASLEAIGDCVSIKTLALD